MYVSLELGGMKPRGIVALYLIELRSNLSWGKVVLGEAYVCYIGSGKRRGHFFIGSCVCMNSGGRTVYKGHITESLELGESVISI